MKFIDKIPGFPTHEFEVVNEWPTGYFIWNIGRQNFPHEGYLPLATETELKYHVNTRKLKALNVGDEDLCLAAMRAAHNCEYFTEDRFLKLKRLKAKRRQSHESN